MSYQKEKIFTLGPTPAMPGNSISVESGYRFSTQQHPFTPEVSAMRELATASFDKGIRRTAKWMIDPNKGVIYEFPAFPTLQKVASAGLETETRISIPVNIRATSVGIFEQEKLPDKVANVAESFMDVEAYLPDYTAELIEVYRQFGGGVEAYYQWGHEEIFHKMMLAQILVRTGSRTAQQVEDREKLVLSRKWIPPFETGRQMTVYTFLQERRTRDYYSDLGRAFKQAGAINAAWGLSLVRADEAYHGSGFETFLEDFFQMDERGTLKDIVFVARHFRMPANFILPDDEERGIQMVRVLRLRKKEEHQRLVSNIAELSFIKDQQQAEALLAV